MCIKNFFYQNQNFETKLFKIILSNFRSELDVDEVKSKDGKSMQPLCMAQHYQMYRIYRRPGANGDEQIILDRITSGNHIIVAHHNLVRF